MVEEEKKDDHIAQEEEDDYFEELDITDGVHEDPHNLPQSSMCPYQDLQSPADAEEGKAASRDFRNQDEQDKTR